MKKKVLNQKEQEINKNIQEKREFVRKYYESLSPQKKLIFKYILNSRRKQKHKLHVVSPSPWPIYSAAAAFLFVMGMVLWMHGYTYIPLLCGFISLLSAFFFWFRDIIREGVYMGYHTEIVQSCLRLGFVLFLVSEVMFFFGFFWALLHYTLTPSIFSGGIWPPQGIVLYLMAEDVNFLHNKDGNSLKMAVPILMRESHETGVLFHDQTDFEALSRRQNHQIEKPVIPHHFSKTYKVPTSEIVNTFIYRFRPANELYTNSSKVHINFYSPGVLINPYRIPLLNTAILLTSGFVLTMAHSYLRVESFLAAFRFLLFTIVMGVLFILLQLYEYTYSGFSMNDGVYGSIFYMLTGFHGFHVIVGTIFLIVCLCRLKASHFTSNNHFAFEAAAWYWHFVDVVWILLYLLLYLWPNAKYFSNSASLVIDPAHSSMYINLNTKYFFRHCCTEPGFKFNAGINFENHYDVKIKVVGFIMDHFRGELKYFEKRESQLLQSIQAQRFRALYHYSGWKKGV